MQSQQDLTQQNLITRNIEEKSSELVCPYCQKSDYVKTGRYKSNKKQKYRCKICQRTFVEEPLNFNNLLLSDDVWLASDLGIRVHQHQSDTKLVFNRIEQEWLKTAVKHFVKYMATTKQFTTLKDYITALNKFSEFLSEQYPLIDFNQLNRSVILAYNDFCLCSYPRCNFKKRNRQVP